MPWIHKWDTIYQSPSVATKLSALPFDDLTPKPTSTNNDIPKPTATSKTNETPKTAESIPKPKKEKTFVEEVKSIVEEYNDKKTKSASEQPIVPPSPKSESTCHIHFLLNSYFYWLDYIYR